MGTSIDMHRAMKCGQFYQPGETGGRFKCAVLLIRHLGKGQKDRAITGVWAALTLPQLVNTTGRTRPRNPQDKAIIHVKAAWNRPSIGYQIRTESFIGRESLTTADNVLALP